MRDPEKFAVLILTHGRADKVITYKALRKHGYTGRIYLVIDNEDDQEADYRKRYGDEVVQFDKAAVARRIDAADQSQDRRTILYARVAAFDVARDLGLDYFLQLDDDYSGFYYRYKAADDAPMWERRVLASPPIRDFDGVVRAMLRFLEDTRALTVAFGQGGEHIGGVASHLARLGIKRKAMNSFFCRTDRPIPFAGRLNEDVNAYCLGGSRGDLYFTVFDVSLVQAQTQQNSGGMTDAYLDVGTYVKSMYTVMMCPSFVSVRSLGRTDRRIHHFIDWDHGIPKILDPRLRKVA